MRLYFHSKKICACTRDVPNNEHFASVEALAGQLETVAKLCPSLLIVVCDTLALTHHTHAHTFTCSTHLAQTLGTQHDICTCTHIAHTHTHT